MPTSKAEEKNKLLLHICCATCGSYISQMLSQGYRVVLYYSNSNIFPIGEYDKRLAEVKLISEKFRLPLHIDAYDHGSWLKHISGLENEKEKGKRCYNCYEYRLKKLAEKAIELDIAVFSTTLSVSPHKVYGYIKEIGDRLARENNMIFHDQDFKKKEGYKKSMLMARELDLYRQKYCGCEFSIGGKDYGGSS